MESGSMKRLLCSVFGLALLLSACGGRAPLGATRELANPLGAHGLSAVATPAPSLTSMGFPRFTYKHTGQQGDPVNLLLAASQPQVERLFADAGWLLADAITPLSVAKMLEGTLDRNVQYPHAPMSDLFLYGRRQDYGFEKNNVGVRERDHLRVWLTTQNDRLGRPIWAIAATKDIAIEWVNRHPTHRIDADLDAERQLVLGDLQRFGKVATSYTLRSLASGYTGTNGDGDPIFTDGLVNVLELAADAPVRLSVQPAPDVTPPGQLVGTTTPSLP
jgi:hypothetical protein